MSKPAIKGYLALAVGVILAGCASNAAQVPSTTQSANSRAVTAATPPGRAKSAEPLSIDEAVRLALTSNRALRARYYQASVSESEVGKAAADAAAKGANGIDLAHPLDAERRFVISMTLPFAQRYGSEVDRRKSQQLRLDIAREMLQVAGATRKAYIAAVAAEENARYLARAAASAEAATELARRMVRVGNWPKLNELRERAFQGEVATQLAKARQIAMAEREQLTRLLGLWGADADYRLPERLADLPGSAAEMADIEEVALRQRLDLQMLRVGFLAEAKEFELDGYDRGDLASYRTGAVTMSESDYFADNPNGEARNIRVPLFDRRQAWRDTKLMPYMTELDRYAEKSINARSEAREAYHAYRTAYDVARHYRDVILPLRREISEENLLRYNGMLISVFELLADAREQITSVTNYIEAQRKFWNAEADLRLALTVGGAGGGSARTVSLPGGSSAAGH